MKHSTPQHHPVDAGRRLTVRRLLSLGALSGLSGVGLTAAPRIALASDANGGFQVIVHPEVKVKEMSLVDLKAVFMLRKRQFGDGTPATLVVLDDQDPRQRAFATQVLQVFPYTLRQSWDQQSLSGAARPPIAVGSPAEMIKRVAATRGAIGYVAARDAATAEGVRYVDVR